MVLCLSHAGRPDDRRRPGSSPQRVAVHAARNLTTGSWHGNKLARPAAKGRLTLTKTPCALVYNPRRNAVAAVVGRVRVLGLPGAHEMRRGAASDAHCDAEAPAAAGEAVAGSLSQPFTVAESQESQPLTVSFAVA